ncbi:MBL fold metallo-hydrolase [Candidatus Lokiarchaeum ossiferum]
MKEFSYKDIKIQWLGHDSFMVMGKTKNIYFDPYQLEKKKYPKADIIISSHEHMDHCHPESINIISNEKTVLIGPKVCQNIFKKDIPIKGEVKELNPYDKLSIEDIKITAIPAYNSHRFRSPGMPFHPKEANHIGPIVEIDGVTLYHAGDADFIPEMKEIDVDIAFLPVSGKYVMDVEECVQAAENIQTKVIIPMHVGRGIGNLEATKELKEKLPNREVILLDIAD